ncbi:MAG: rhodanese-like domain-containing protein [Tissierellia bacterium]|nr:rhodanese-like domain-containing protein [Tissierellia bacterium]
MKNKIFKILTLIFVVSSFMMACSGGKSGDATETADGFKEMKGEELESLNEGKEKDSILIIDVRPEEEYLAGNIPNSINILSDDIDKNIEKIKDYKENKIIVYCNTGNRSAKAAKVLVDNGFKDVYNAQGVKEYEYKLVNYTDILASDLLDMMNEDGIVLVDYRPKDLYDKGHIKGAINIELDEITDNLDKLPKDAKILLYCNTGTKSALAADELTKLGYENVFNSIEGVKEYDFDLVK